MEQGQTSSNGAEQAKQNIQTSMEQGQSSISGVEQTKQNIQTNMEQGQSSTSGSEQNKQNTDAFQQIGLSKELILACEKLGWGELSEVQKIVIPLTLGVVGVEEDIVESGAEEDLICIGRKHLGKLSAIALSILVKSTKPVQPFYVCIMTSNSTRASIIAERFHNLGFHINLKCVVLDDGGGGEGSAEIDHHNQVFRLQKLPHVVIGKPNCILKHLISTDVYRQNIGNLRFFVLDRADALFRHEDLIRNFVGSMPQKPTMYLLGDTSSLFIDRFHADFMSKNTRTVDRFYDYDTMWNQCISVKTKRKTQCLVYLLKRMCSSLPTVVFTCEPSQVQMLDVTLRYMKINGICVSSHMAQQTILDGSLNFQDQKSNIFVCDDKAVSLLSFPSPYFIINYDIPKKWSHDNNFLNFKHRFGKTGTAGIPKRMISLLNKKEERLFFDKIGDLMKDTYLGEIVRLKVKIGGNFIKEEQMKQ